MNALCLNFTAFDVQLWPPIYDRPAERLEHVLDPTLVVPILVFYHAVTSIALQAPNVRDYQGRHDTHWFGLYLYHHLILGCFIIHLAIVHRSDYTLLDNLGFMVFTAISTLLAFAT